MGPPHHNNHSNPTNIRNVKVFEDRWIDGCQLLLHAKST